MQTDTIKPSIKGIFFKDFDNSYIPHILKEIYLDRIYVPYLSGRKDLIIADWGGNIGLTSNYFKDFAKQVYCVEPSKQHIECIDKMILQNQIKNIKVCPYAISNENGKTKFFHNDNVTMFSLKDTVNNKKDFEEVETVTVDSFFEREKIDHIDLLKWDTEGFESEILVSDGFKKSASKIHTIVGEWHQWTSMNQYQFKEAFEVLGFQFNWLMRTEASVYSAVRV